MIGGHESNLARLPRRRSGCATVSSAGPSGPRRCWRRLGKSARESPVRDTAPSCPHVVVREVIRGSGPTTRPFDHVSITRKPFLTTGEATLSRRSQLRCRYRSSATATNGVRHRAPPPSRLSSQRSRRTGERSLPDLMRPIDRQFRPTGNWLITRISPRALVTVRQEFSKLQQSRLPWTRCGGRIIHISGFGVTSFTMTWMSFAEVWLRSASGFRGGAVAMRCGGGPG